MKKLLFTLLLPISLFGQQPIKSKAALERVTVYTNGAQLNHQGKVTIPAGTSEVVISNLSSSVNENSIQVGISAGVTILSLQYNRDYLNEKIENPTIRKLNDSIKIVSAQLTKTKNEKSIEEQTLILLDENRKSGGVNTGTNVAELIKLTEYYRSKNAEVKNTIASLTLIEEKQNQKINAFQQQIAALKNNPNQQLGQIVLQLMAKQQTEASYMASYVSPSANWRAGYDIKAINTANPLALVYKAAITQNTGLDWKKVDLSLSTGSPNYNITAPVLNPWFVYSNSIQNALAGGVAGLMAEADQQSLKETTIRIRGSASISAPSTMNAYTTVNESQLGVTFNIDVPYDVNSDNKPHTVAFKEYELPAKYKYYAAPRASSDAYLLAEVSDWEKLNLQAGEANIIFENTYTGKSYINPSSIRDTLSVSMGRDKKIIISKEKVNDFSSTKFIGSNKKQTFTYTITIRNGKKEPIELNLKDQYPLSTSSDIEVELIDSSGAEVSKETGMLSWQLKMQPNSTKVIKLSYSVRSPKDKMLSGL